MRLVLRCVCIIVCVTLFFSIAGCNLNSGSVATIGNEKLSTTDYKYFLRIAKLSIETDKKIVLSANNEAALKKYQDEKKKFWKVKSNLTNLRKKALDDAKEFKIQLSKAKENKISLTKKEKDDTTQRVETNIVNQNGTLAAAKLKVKEDYNVTLDELKKIALDYALINKFIEGEIKKIVVDDVTIEKEYNKNKDSFDSVTVQHILFSTTTEDNKKLSADKIKEKKTKADEVLKKAESGEDFKALATKYSEDPGVKENSGEYTVNKDGKMVKEFEDWAFKAKKGDIGLVETQFGYHIMKFIKRATFADSAVKTSVKTKIQQEKFKKIYDGWLKEKKYKVQKDDDAIKNADIGKI